MTQKNQWNNTFQGKKPWGGGEGELSQVNNSPYQVEIYNQEYQFVVNWTRLPNWSLNSIDFLDVDLFSHEPPIHALIFNTLDSWRLGYNCTPLILAIWIWSLVGACRVRRYRTSQISQSNSQHLKNVY